MRQKQRRRFRWHRMTREEQIGYMQARYIGARKTAVAIRAGKCSIGQALVMAEREIGPAGVWFILRKVCVVEWSLAALRYLPSLTDAQRQDLLYTIDQRGIKHAKWALENMSHLGEHEKKMLESIVSQ